MREFISYLMWNCDAKTYLDYNKLTTYEAWCVLLSICWRIFRAQDECENRYEGWQKSSLCISNFMFDLYSIERQKFMYNNVGIQKSYE